MKTLKIFKATIPSNVNYVNETIKNILCYIQSVHIQMSEDTLFESKVILNELILNAIKHGNKHESSKNVSIAVGLTENEYMFFIIEDEGEGYDYNCCIRNKAGFEDIADFCDMKEHGRGILIVKNLCERIKFNCKGNKVVALKKV